MAITQKQLADHLGVSTVVISRGLNGHSSVAAKTRLRIEQAARDLGYDSINNRGARMMAAKRHGRQGCTGVIALLVPAPTDFMKVREEPYFMPIFAGVEAATTARELEIVICPAKIGSLPSIIAAGEVDGVLIVFAGHEQRERLTAIDRPVVAVNQRIENFHSVDPDDGDGIRQAVMHLYDLGHRRIAYLGQTLHSTGSKLRFAAYRSTLQTLGIAPDPALEETTVDQLDPDRAGSCLRNLLERGADFTALVCYNDTIAMGAVNALQAAGKRVPGQVSVTGFDDISGFHNFRPALTSVHIPTAEICDRAVELLYRLIAARNDGGPAASNASKAKKQHEIVPVQLEVRASTAPLGSSTRKE